MSGARCRMVGCPHRCPRVPSRALLSLAVVVTVVVTLVVAPRGCVRPPAGARRPLSHRLRAVSRQIVMRQVVERGSASRDSRIAGAGEQRLWAVAKSPCTHISEVNRREHRSVHESAPWRVGHRAVENRTHTAAQVSRDLGFCSQSHVTRVFRRLAGITPHHCSRGCRRTKG